MPVSDRGCGCSISARGRRGRLPATGRKGGPTGRVIGLDQHADAVRLAEERASARGAGNTTFVHSELSQYAPEAPLDAIVGRLVLMYQPDPGAALASLARHLRPGEGPGSTRQGAEPGRSLRLSGHGAMLAKQTSP